MRAILITLLLAASAQAQSAISGLNYNKAHGRLGFSRMWLQDVTLNFPTEFLDDDISIIGFDWEPTDEFPFSVTEQDDRTELVFESQRHFPARWHIDGLKPWLTIEDMPSFTVTLNGKPSRQPGYATPEPSTIMLIGLGLIVLVGMRRSCES